MRQLLEAGDVDGLRRYWREKAPSMPQPETRDKAEVAMHMARTASEAVEFRHRAYSHRWLTERSFPSQLPDHLKPSAERLYPRIVEGVLVSANFRSKVLKPAAAEVQDAMCKAVEDCYANGDTDPELVRRQMKQAQQQAMKQLFGYSSLSGAPRG